MTARTDLAERIKQVMDDHSFRSEGRTFRAACMGCDWQSLTGDREGHRAHLSAVLTDAVAGWLTGDAAVETAAEAMLDHGRMSVPGECDCGLILWKSGDDMFEHQARAALSAVLREGDER